MGVVGVVLVRRAGGEETAGAFNGAEWLAKNAGIPVVKRAELLGPLMRGQHAIGVRNRMNDVPA